MPEVIAFGIVLAIGAIVVASMVAAQNAHEDKLDRRAMYNEVMEMNRIDAEIDLAMIGDDMEKLNAWLLDADGKRAERKAKNLAIAKEAFGIK